MHDCGGQSRDWPGWQSSAIRSSNPKNNKQGISDHPFHIAAIARVIKNKAALSSQETLCSWLSNCLNKSGVAFDSLLRQLKTLTS